MKIGIDYEGKKYNFDIPYNATVKSLKETSQKILKSDNALLNLMLGKEKIDWNDDKILIKDLIPNGNATFIVKLDEQMKKTKQKFKNEKIKSTNNSKDKLFNTQDLVINKEKFEKEKIEKEKNQKENNENLEKLNKDNFSKTKNKIRNKIKSENHKKTINKIYNHTVNILNNDTEYLNNIELKLFLANYIKKSNDLFAMMKAFNDKIKEVNLNLFHKSKNFDDIQGNNIYFCEMSLFQKRVFDFQDKQINYYKKLIEILNINSTNNKNLDEFYNKLIDINEDKIFSKNEITKKNIFKKGFPRAEIIKKMKVTKTNELLKLKKRKNLKLPNIHSNFNSNENSVNEETFMINEFKNNNNNNSKLLERNRRNSKLRNSDV